MKEVEDFSSVNPIHQKIPNEEIEVSPLKFSVNHIGSRRFFPSGSHIYITHLFLSEFFTIPSGSYSCTYPLGIEYASTVEKVEVEIEIETKVTPRQEPYQNR